MVNPALKDTSSRVTTNTMIDLPADILAEIAAIYSHLSPLFAAVRANPSLAGNTLLPNALSPLAPAMAWGHCGNLSHGDARRLLRRNPEWKASADRLAALYERYKELTGNALMWAGWNYWNPAAPETPLDGRVLQVVLTADLAAMVDLFEPSRQLLEAGNHVVSGRDFLQPPLGYPQGEVVLGSRPSGDSGLLAPDLIQPRLFLFNLWESLFVPSAIKFQQDGMPTIVDHVKAEFLRYLDSKPGDFPSPVDDIEVVFQPPGEFLTSTHPGALEIRSFVCLSQWTHAIWHAVERELTEHAALELAAGLKPSQRLLRAWHRLALRPPPDLEPARASLGQALRISLDSAPAYVLLQHLALFERFLHSHHQYILPISFGRHLFVAFLAMRKRLSRSELLGWRNIVTTLFGGLIVERVSDLLHHQQLDARETELRRVLSHAMPKAVFQPAQYFAGKILMAMPPSGASGVAQRDANALLFLLAKGQADLAALAPHRDDGRTPHAGGTEPETPDNDEVDSPLDLFAACDDLKAHFDAIKEFLLAGQLDRPNRDSVATNLGCEVLPVDHRPRAMIRMNRSLLFFHLWNLIDNAFRHGGIVARARRTLSKIQISVSVNGAIATLKVQNAGDPITADDLLWLNGILTAAPNSWSRDKGSGLGPHSRPFPETEMEDDHEGSGLARFSLYLASLWDRAGAPNHTRGKAQPLAEGTSIEFYLPCESAYD